MRNFVVIAGLLAVPAETALEVPMDAQTQVSQDPRLLQLDKYFVQHDCPIRSMAADFLAAADNNDLDWRLLPSISVIESGGGKDYRNNNIFGWDACRERFPSVRAGIHIVAGKLSKSKIYRDKDVNGILSIYNPRPEYPGRVKSVMRTISASLN
jgi:hypothetical protein